MLFTACSTEKQQHESDYFNQTESDSLRVTLTEVWTTDSTQSITPECVTYDPGSNVFYVSNINRDNETENDGYISVVNADGSIKMLGWPKGWHHRWETIFMMVTCLSVITALL